jgi:hypothetical protein
MLDSIKSFVLKIFKKIIDRNFTINKEHNEQQ